MSTNERNQNNQIVQLSTCPILLSLCPLSPHLRYNELNDGWNFSSRYVFKNHLVLWYFGKNEGANLRSRSIGIFKKHFGRLVGW